MIKSSELVCSDPGRSPIIFFFTHFNHLLWSKQQIYNYWHGSFKIYILGVLCMYVQLVGWRPRSTPAWPHQFSDSHPSGQNLRIRAHLYNIHNTYACSLWILCVYCLYVLWPPECRGYPAGNNHEQNSSV